LETSNDRYWSASREPQRSMTSRGYDPRQSPGLGYKRVVSCKDSFHGTDVLAVSEHGAPGRRPNIHAHFVGRQREDGLDTHLPRVQGAMAIARIRRVSAFRRRNVSISDDRREDQGAGRLAGQDALPAPHIDQASRPRGGPGVEVETGSGLIAQNKYEIGPFIPRVLR